MWTTILGKEILKETQEGFFLRVQAWGRLLIDLQIKKISVNMRNNSVSLGKPKLSRTKSRSLNGQNEDENNRELSSGGTDDGS